MRKAIIVISGFTEGQYEMTGSAELHTKLFDRFNAFNGHDDITIVFPLKKWKHDWDGFAAYLNRNHYDEALVAAYSWGAGFGLREFSKAFDGQVKAVLCDPVYRSKYPWMRWLALRKKQNTIKYGKNVEVLHQFAQKMDEPGNDRVVSQGEVIRPTYIAAPHSQIDNSETYHLYTIKAAKDFTNA